MLVDFLVTGFFGKLISDEGSIGYWIVMVGLLIGACILVGGQVKFVTKLMIYAICLVLVGGGGVIGLFVTRLIIGFLALLAEGDENIREREAEKRAQMSPEERRLYDIQKELKGIKDELRWKL